MSSEEDADLDALTSPAATATVAPTATENSNTPSDAANGTPPVVKSETVKEERKVGKLNLAAFAPQANANPPPSASTEDRPKPGKLAAFQMAAAASATSTAPSDARPPPGRANVGKLADKMNIPIFAPGSAPPMPGASANASANAGTSSYSSEASSSSSSAAPNGDSSSSSSAKAGPGKLQANALMSNLNAMLGAGPPRKRPSITSEEGATFAQAANEPETMAPPPQPASSSSNDQIAASSSSSSSSSSSANANNDESGPAPTITHAKRARVRRKSKTKASTLQKAEITTKFEEVKLDNAPVGGITVVSAGPSASSSSVPSSASSSAAHSRAPSSMNGQTLPPAPSPVSSPTAAQSARDASAAALLTAASSPKAEAELKPVVAAPPADPVQRAAYNAAASAYGEFIEQEYDESKADQYLLLTAAGSTFLKHGASGKPHERVVFVTANFILYYMEASKRNKPDPKNSINLSLATIPKIRIVKGKTTSSFQRSTAAKVDENLCFSIIAKERELDLQAKSVEERDTWYAALQYLIQLAKDRREAAMLTSAMG